MESRSHPKVGKHPVPAFLQAKKASGQGTPNPNPRRIPDSPCPTVRAIRESPVPPERDPRRNQQHSPARTLPTAVPAKAGIQRGGAGEAVRPEGNRRGEGGPQDPRGKGGGPAHHRPRLTYPRS